MSAAGFRVVGRLLRERRLGPRIGPIIPDKARKFGLESEFKEHGTYASNEQLYETVDQDSILRYREARDPKILEEGVTEAGALVQLLDTGPLLPEARRAAETLEAFFGVGVAVWSATSNQQLRADALACERWKRLHPLEPPRVPYVAEMLGGQPGPVVAVSDFA